MRAPAAKAPAAPPAGRPAPAAASGNRPKLPGRDNLFMAPPGPKRPAPKAAPVEDEELPDDADVQDEDAGDEGEGRKKSFEERLGTTGVVLIAILAAVITWMLMNMFMPRT
jgi:hypothetical protein